MRLPIAPPMISEKASDSDHCSGLSRRIHTTSTLTTTTEMDLENMEKLMKLVDALEDDDDVQRVTTNFEASDEVMAQL